MMNMSAEIESPLSPRPINHQKKVSPRQALNELEETLMAIDAKPIVEEKAVEVKAKESAPEPVAPVIPAAQSRPQIEVRKSLSLVDELAASIDSLEDSIRRNSPSASRKSSDIIPPVPPQPSNPKIVLTNSGGSPKASPKKDGAPVPKVGVVKVGTKKPKQPVKSNEADGELLKKLQRMRERSDSQKDLTATNSSPSPSKPSELDSVLDSLAALSQQPLGDKAKSSPTLNLSSSSATTASITELIDSYSAKPLPSPPPVKRNSSASLVAPKEPEVKPEIKPEIKPEVQPKKTAGISPQVKPDANPLGNLLDQLIVNATTPAKPSAPTSEETPSKRPPPLSMTGAMQATSNANLVVPDMSKAPLTPHETTEIDEYLSVKTPSKSNLEHQPRYGRGAECKAQSTAPRTSN
jgi:hypothetical protein